MNYKNKIVSTIIDLIERLKGTRELIPLEEDKDIYTMELEIDNGSVITISCEEIKYILKYERWWVLDKKITIYKVSSKTINSNDLIITHKFNNKVLYINNLWFLSSDSINKKKLAISAFVDLIKYSSLTH